MGSGPAGNVEAAWRMGARRVGVSGVVGAKDVLDEAAVHAVIGEDVVFGVDEKTLTADRTANV